MKQPQLAVCGMSMVLLACLAACTKESADKRSYTANCYRALREDAVCDCTYDELRKNHTSRELADAARSEDVPPAQLLRDMTQATLVCMRKIRP
jgi:hypothetical protein